MSKRINVKFRPGTNAHIDWDEVRDIIGDFNIVAQTPPLRLFTIEVEDDDVAAVMDYLNSLDCVVRVSVDALANPCYVRLSPVPAPLEHIPKQWALSRMDVFEAHRYQKGSPDVVVAIIDTGLYEDHEEFANRSVPGISAVGNEWNDPDMWHGTACGCCVSPSYATGKITAVAPNVTLLSIRAQRSGVNGFYWSDLVTAVSIAVANGADLVSLSLGGPSPSVEFEEAIDQAINAGVLFVKAAGNDGKGGGLVGYPQHEGILQVGSINSANSRSYFSSYGPLVHLVAPGEGIIVAGIDDPTQYLIVNGTSFSCPYVAAVCALVKSENPDLSNEQIKEIVCSETTEVADPDFDIYFTREGGIGCVNALKAVLKARSMRDDKQGQGFQSLVYEWGNKTVSYIEDVFNNYFEATYVSMPAIVDTNRYGSGDVFELFQGENYIYRGPKTGKVKISASPDSVIKTVSPLVEK